MDTPRLAIGEPAVMVEEDALCPDCGDHHDIEKCPRCGSWIELGYGLMAGAMGSYKFCTNDQCRWVYVEPECIGCGGFATTNVDGKPLCDDCISPLTQAGVV
jgi:predicted amidophosphoribosyltransferase